VNHRRSSLLALAALLTITATAAAQDRITVDVTSVVADVSRKPIGTNVNFLLDHDANRANAVDRLAQALKKAGVKYLRYPGGEKSDAYLWALPPYTSPTPTLARWAAGEYPRNQEWPSYDRNLVEPDGRTFKTTPLDFDEFMAVCREIACVPTVVVCYDSMYKPAQTGGVAPTRAQLLETAREWVRYANITRGYNVKYWEIGNESYLQHYNGSATASNYARDLIEFSRVMKAVDPTILIGANGESESWWRTILSTASGAIDFLAVHNYPATNWGSYSYYKNNNANLMAHVQTAQRAIASYAPAADRDRLVIASTEINSADWSGAWPHRNDMGHALVLFDLFGAHLANPKVAFTQLWNTRWSGNDTVTTPALWDALDKDNELQATGRALAIWGQFLKEDLVSSSSTAMVRSYTTHSRASRKTSVFLINKDTVARPTTVTVNGSSSGISIETWSFQGNGAGDLYPTWAHQGQRRQAENLIAVTLAPVSVTVLDITAEAPPRKIDGPPTALQASVVGQQVTLTWSPPPGDGSVASYVIEAGSMSDASNVVQFDTGSAATTLVVNAAPGTYYVRVRGWVNGSLSAPTNEVVVVVHGGCGILTPPAAVSHTVSGHTGAGAAVQVMWPSVASATSYLLEAGSRPGLSDLATIESGHTYLTTMAPPGTYYVRVRARSACGTSAPSDEHVVIVGGCPTPESPVTLTGSVRGSVVTLDWGAVSQSTGYVIEVGATPNATALQLQAGAATRFTAAAPGGTYYVRVRAGNTCGAGAVSNEIVVTVPGSSGGLSP
jgi:alpha-L-arabinofuranosidase